MFFSPIPLIFSQVLCVGHIGSFRISDEHEASSRKVLKQKIKKLLVQISRGILDVRDKRNRQTRNSFIPRQTKEDSQMISSGPVCLSLSDKSTNHSAVYISQQISINIS
jgi:hypothetical protein